MKRTVFTLAWFAPLPAAAHGLPTPHAHPHTIDLLVGLLLVAVLVLAYVAWRRRRRL